MNASVNYSSPKSFDLAMAIYEQFLDKWPVPAERRFVPTSLGDAFILTFGDPANPPLVLLHGSASNSASWGLDAEEFAKIFRVHAIDLPGETGKGSGARPTYEGTVYPDWLKEVLDGLGLAQVSICGLSLGGWVGLKFAASFPERVTKLVLLAPGGVAPARESFTASADSALELGEEGIRELAAAIFSPQPPPPGVIEGFIFMQSIYKTRRDNLPVITDSELAAVAAPTLLIAGAQDALLDMTATEARLSRLLPNFESQMDPSAGHALIGRGKQVVDFLVA